MKTRLKVSRKVIGYIDTEIEVEASSPKEAIEKLQSAEFCDSLCAGHMKSKNIKIIDECPGLDYHDETLDSTTNIVVEPFAYVTYEDDSTHIFGIVPRCPKCEESMHRSTLHGYDWSCDHCGEDFMDGEAVWNYIDLK